MRHHRINMARGGKRKSSKRNNSRKEHSRNSKGPAKKKFKFNKSDDASAVGNKAKNPPSLKEEEAEESSVEEESEEEETALDKLLSTFGDDSSRKNKPVDSESDDQDNGEEEEEEDVSEESEDEPASEQDAVDELVELQSDHEEESDEEEEAAEQVKDSEKENLKHFEKEFEEAEMKKILSKSDRSCKDIQHPYLGSATFTSYVPGASCPEGGASGLQDCLSTYADLMLCDRERFEDKEVVTAVCAHVLRHVLRSRAKILHHTAKLKAAKRGAELEYRDQGLARPKALIVLPFRSRAERYVTELISQMGADATVMNKVKFYREFTLDKEEAAEEERRLSRKPLDFQQLFGAGSADETFRLGISLKRKCVRLYAPFYTSDVIICSPVGLHIVTLKDWDFLSSVEVLVLDECHVMQMQNWERVLTMAEKLHQRPKDAHGVDFSRVRSWALEEGWAKVYRQTLAFSSVVSSELVSYFNKFCFNYAGLISCKNTRQGDILRVAVQLPQSFQRFQVSSIKEDADERLRFFIETVLPQYKSDLLRGTLIFVPSYFDYVRLRNHFRNQDVSFVQICEYTHDGKTAEARDKFFHRYRKFLLYTERAHFYNRYVIKGTRHLLFYQLPLIPRFYSEMCNQLSSGNDSTCSVILSRYDSYRLAAVVGHDRACKILSNANKVHLLVSGDI